MPPKDINIGEAMDEYINELNRQEINLLNGDKMSVGAIYGIDRSIIRFTTKLRLAFNDWCELRGYKCV